GKMQFADRYDIGSVELSAVLKRPLPFELPTSGDHPLVGYLSPNNIATEIDRINNFDVDRNFIAEYSKCLEAALKSSQAVLLTYG
ncbi:MAG: hypothetical protein AAF664_23195, partial [Planctomycetota bacterium]